MERLKELEEESRKLEEESQKAQEEVGPICEKFGNYLRNTLGELRAGHINEKNARERLRDEVDIAIYSAMH